MVTVDTEGRKVSNATVLVSGSGLWPAKQTRTDLEGHAQVLDLARGFYDFRATRGDLVSPPGAGSPLGRGETKTVTLVLAPGRKVAVRVVDGEEEGAKGIAGASLVLSEGGLSSFPLEGKTDARGGATLGPIAPGDAYLSARAPGFVARTGVPMKNGPPVEVVVALVRGATLLGEVVDSRGFPVDGASIEVVGTTASGEPIDESPIEPRSARHIFPGRSPSPVSCVARASSESSWGRSPQSHSRAPSPRASCAAAEPSRPPSRG